MYPNAIERKRLHTNIDKFNGCQVPSFHLLPQDRIHSLPNPECHWSISTGDCEHSTWSPVPLVSPANLSLLRGHPKGKCNHGLCLLSLLSLLKNYILGASLVVQWLRICLPMQGTRVRALVWEDPTCRGATGPVSHNY
ncbi:hypothetical protein J1605_016998 [Eschrichtius robustus]|uniref:Uncharacterized protein n=1 Tax=Eschrichtius robustus TaxID=9764 RepID=A0AB34I412_ESCRO|nr:hypothetical protein J1605_016998 [Eschrichtius robustus]